MWWLCVVVCLCVGRLCSVLSCLKVVVMLLIGNRCLGVRCVWMFGRLVLMIGRFSVIVFSIISGMFL